MWEMWEMRAEPHIGAAPARSRVAARPHPSRAASDWAWGTWGWLQARGRGVAGSWARGCRLKDTGLRPLRQGVCRVRARASATARPRCAAAAAAAARSVAT